MIKDFKVNQMVTATLVVMSATARETKAKKPYLQMELYDGIDTIQANYWDWSSGKIPEKNLVVDITGQVTEYAGSKQVNVKTMTQNTTKHLSEFMPTAMVNIGDVYKEALALAYDVTDDFLRDLALSVLETLRDLWLEVPGAKGVHHAFVGGTLVHSLSVAKIALAISKQLPDSNDDLCFVGGLLHDIGKLYTYKISGITVEMTDEGMLYDHTFMGAEFLGNFAETLTTVTMDPKASSKMEIIRHIILSHHGVLEYGAAVPPMCIEAHIVSRADGVDAAVQQIIEASRKVEGSKFTDRIYTLSNKPQMTPEYIQGVMSTQVASNG